jgi:uncharacterized linocin/CFP29 family protein
MGIRPYQPLRPIQISRSFLLYREQSGDDDILKALITQAAADLAQAEDAVILLGCAAEVTLKKLKITFDHKDLKEQQVQLVPETAVEPIAGNILNSILKGIQDLQKNGYYGEYHVIVSPDLYSQAYARPSGRSALIHEIQVLLPNNSFLSSSILGREKGVIFSLTRGTIRLSVPVDTYVDTSIPNDDQGRQQFRVAQQFRLIIDDECARVALRPPQPSSPPSGTTGP